MRTILAAATLTIALTACGGSNDASPTAARTASAVPGITAIPTPAGATRTTATSAPAETPAQAASVEVTGIVGSVNAASRLIEIRRLQGANVTQIEITNKTAIRKAAGGTAQLKDVKPSDRIVAKGPLNDRGDALVATEVTVQDVLPGAQPGG